MKLRTSLVLLAAAAVLVLPAVARADDATLRTTLDTWSQKIGVDAHSVSLAAAAGHPRRMIYSAKRFRADALKARAALAAETPSTASGVQARKLAVTAFTDYALAGRRWVLSGRAHIAHQFRLAAAYARAGGRYARAGNTLLVRAGTLIP